MQENSKHYVSVDDTPTEDLSDPTSIRLARIEVELEQLRHTVFFFTEAVIKIKNKTDQPLTLKEELLERVYRNTAHLRFFRYALVLTLGLFSVVSATIAGTEYSKHTEYGDVTFKGSEFISTASAIAGGLGVTVIGFADRLNRGKNLPKK
jgi:hypothetical protein